MCSPSIALSGLARVWSVIKFVKNVRNLASQVIEQVVQTLEPAGGQIVDVFQLKPRAVLTLFSVRAVKTDAQHEGMDIVEDEVTVFVNFRRQVWVRHAVASSNYVKNKGQR